MDKEKIDKNKIEIVEGIIENFVDCCITLRVQDYFLTIPTSRILQIKHSLFSARMGLSDTMKGLRVIVELIPKNKINKLKKW